MQRLAHAPTASLQFQKGPLILGGVNLLVLFTIERSTGVSMAGAFISAGAFWGLLSVFPGAINRAHAFAPRNYALFVFFMTMVLGAAMLPFDDIRERLWVMSYAAWDTSQLERYIPLAGFFWALAFFFYLLGQHDGRRAPERRLPPTWEGEPATDWMLLIGGMLVVFGIAGLSIAVGGIGQALALGGSRQIAEEAFVAGTYRYLIWMEGVPLGACLLWYFWVRKLQLGGVGGAVLALLFYAPLFPFYIYSSGRARAIFPLLLLVAMYHRYARRFSVWWLVGGLAGLVPILAAWAWYRTTGEFKMPSVQDSFAVVGGDFSRFDVTAAALGGFYEGNVDLLWGETLVVAFSRWLPFSLQLDELTGGTLALIKALYGDSDFELASPYATALPIEGFLNFGWFGVALFLFVLGRIIRWLDRLARSRELLPYLFALVFTYKLPFGVSTEIVTGQLVWALGVPFATLWAARELLGLSRSRFRAVGSSRRRSRATRQAQWVPGHPPPREEPG